MSQMKCSRLRACAMHSSTVISKSIFQLLPLA